MKRIFAIVFILMMSVVGTIHAQGESLLVVMGGELYTWSGDASQTVVPYTNCDPAERIVSDIALSNDGRIAYLTEPQAVTTAIQQFGAQGPLPTNVRICDGTSLSAIATQPDNFTFFNSDVPDAAIIRTTPTWSPDGTALAWTSFNLPAGLMFLNIYNANGDGETISTRVNLPLDMGPPAPPFITWGNNGIYMFHATLDAETFAFVELVFLFDGLGNLMFESQLPATDETRFVYDKFIVEDNGQEFIGLLYSDRVWELVNPTTGEAQPANGVGELYDPSGNSDISLLLNLDQSQQYIWTAKNSSGIIVDINGNNVAVPGVFPTSTELSSGGQWVFQLFDGLYFWSMTASGYINGTEAVTSGFSAVAWSDAKWRIHRGVMP